ncbi:hypothetical protein CEXT_705341 [Caerostris extrusa]|uniref:Uncharacterized protein n=1 Tax=Caerostris extrusa TaxID=172846 RepID=A0AAV4WA61_CAEEX|nr:hypothetical protein CEXT_705341 [Caerostris extrusa]
MLQSSLPIKSRKFNYNSFRGVDYNQKYHLATPINKIKWIYPQITESSKIHQDTQYWNPFTEMHQQRKQRQPAILRKGYNIKRHELFPRLANGIQNGTESGRDVAKSPTLTTVSNRVMGFLHYLGSSQTVSVIFICVLIFCIVIIIILVCYICKKIRPKSKYKAQNPHVKYSKLPNYGPFNLRGVYGFQLKQCCEEELLSQNAIPYEQDFSMKSDLDSYTGKAQTTDVTFTNEETVISEKSDDRKPNKYILPCVNLLSYNGYNLKSYKSDSSEIESIYSDLHYETAQKQ